MVVGLDLEYRGKSGKVAPGRAATLSIWRPKLIADGDTEELIAHQEVVNLMRCNQANIGVVLIH